MIFEMVWFGSILSCAALYVWGYVLTSLPRRRPRSGVAKEARR
ncbi:hypothetical protein [Inquilinus sp.]|jgi:hypothetical protein